MAFAGRSVFKRLDVFLDASLYLDQQACLVPVLAVLVLVSHLLLDAARRCNYRKTILGGAVLTKPNPLLHERRLQTLRPQIRTVVIELARLAFGPLIQLGDIDQNLPVG